MLTLLACAGTSSSPKPVQVPAGLADRLDLSYGPDPLQTLDVFFPVAGTPIRGTIITVHGGGWVGGDKADVRDYCRYVAANLGGVVVNCNYRLASPTGTNGITVTSMLDDIDRVKAYLAVHETELFCDSKRLALVGFSAGGHLALMNSLSRNGNATGSGSPTVKVCASFSGPTDLSDPDLHDNVIGIYTGLQLVQSLTGLVWNPGLPTTVDYYRAYSPRFRVAEANAAFLVVHGEADSIVPFGQAAAFAANLQSSGKSVILRSSPTDGHDLATLLIPTTLADLKALFDSALK